VWNLTSHIKRRTQIKDVWEQGAWKNFCTYEWWSDKDWRKLHNTDVCTCHSSLNKIRMIKLRRIWRTGHATYMWHEKAYRTVVTNLTNLTSLPLLQLLIVLYWPYFHYNFLSNTFLLSCHYLLISMKYIMSFLKVLFSSLIMESNNSVFLMLLSYHDLCSSDLFSWVATHLGTCTICPIFPTSLFCMIWSLHGIKHYLDLGLSAVSAG
jgi:hypothetical protein